MALSISLLSDGLSNPGQDQIIAFERELDHLGPAGSRLRMYDVKLDLKVR